MFGTYHPGTYPRSSPHSATNSIYGASPAPSVRQLGVLPDLPSPIKPESGADLGTDYLEMKNRELDLQLQDRIGRIAEMQEAHAAEMERLRRAHESEMEELRRTVEEQRAELEILRRRSFSATEGSIDGASGVLTRASTAGSSTSGSEGVERDDVNGQLVALVKKITKRLAEEKQKNRVLEGWSPGPGGVEIGVRASRVMDDMREVRKSRSASSSESATVRGSVYEPNVLRRIRGP